MYDAAKPPSGPSTNKPIAARNAWYFQVPGTGSHCQRRTEGTGAEIDVMAADATSCRGRGKRFSDDRKRLLARGRGPTPVDPLEVVAVQLKARRGHILAQMFRAAGLGNRDDARLGQQPGQRHLRGADAVLAPDRRQRAVAHDTNLIERR